ncbi:hypothetical protein BCR33DRAFT_848147 [Rhizoclosmatium globosum]|uniref:RTA1-domain-containing protein n=1 Tax=Rhizoclosmatium globosum TaxID=329046 RepID=A0A1Y2CM53_9FUNG|nr:hypothetical protein BCR33DRAFT_848147 [Rhizoclosmatium globosum]|eukprot:ORY48092.1 hypothetical protein BCR33DRAFT_848147 [Rhizoclosmatium globosum]
MKRRNGKKSIPQISTQTGMNSTYQKLPDGSGTMLSPHTLKNPPYLAPIAAATFCLLSAFHLYLGIRYRTTYMIPLILGCLGELVGYCYRYLSIQLPFDITRFAVQYIAIIVAPILITTSLYTLLEKAFGEVFVGVEVVTLLVQVGGAQMASDQYATKETRDLGVSVLIGGISLQLVSFFCYLGMAGWFYKRAVQLETQYVLPLNSNWKRLFKTLIVSSFAESQAPWLETNSTCTDLTSF